MKSQQNIMQLSSKVQGGFGGEHPEFFKAVRHLTHGACVWDQRPESFSGHTKRGKKVDN